MESVRIGIGVSSIGRFLPLVGQAAGLFDKAGIAVEIVNRQDEERVVADIMSHETPVGTPNAPSLIFSALEGGDLVIVGGVLNRPAFYLAARPAIGGIADLKGKKIGINQPRRMAGLVMLALLRKWNLDPARDVRLVDLGLNDKSLEALRAGAIDAALLPPEKAFLAEAEGFRLAGHSLALACHWVPLATTRRFLSAHRELVGKIASVYMDSIRVFKTRPLETLQEIARHLPALADQPAVLDKCRRLFAEQFEPELMPYLDSIQSTLDEVARQDPRAASIDPASLVERVI
ncbi:MAG TPA: ABC transporter substrate-binding protein [Candidatus Binatia bacterium]